MRARASNTQVRSPMGRRAELKPETHASHAPFDFSLLAFRLCLFFCLLATRHPGLLALLSPNKRNACACKSMHARRNECCSSRKNACSRTCPRTRTLSVFSCMFLSCVSFILPSIFLWSDDFLLADVPGLLQISVTVSHVSPRVSNLDFQNAPGRSPDCACRARPH